MTQPESVHTIPSYDNGYRWRSRERNARDLALLEGHLTETNSQLDDIQSIISGMLDDDNYSQERHYVDAACRLITAEQRQLLAEYVQNGDKRNIPSGVVTAYEGAIRECDIRREQLYQHEEYQAKKIQPTEQLLQRLGATAIELDEIWSNSPVARELKVEHDRIDDTIANINAEMAYYMGLAVPPRAIVPENKIKMLWGDSDTSLPLYMDDFSPESDTPHHIGGGSQEGVSRVCLEEHLTGASRSLAGFIAQAAFKAWTPQELGDKLYSDSDEPPAVRSGRVRSLLGNAKRGDVTIINDELSRRGLKLQRGTRYYVDKDGTTKNHSRVYRAVPLESEDYRQTVVEKQPSDSSWIKWDSDDSGDSDDAATLVAADVGGGAEVISSVVTPIDDDRPVDGPTVTNDKIGAIPERLEEIASKADVYIKKLVSLQYQPNRKDIHVGVLLSDIGEHDINRTTLLNKARRVGFINKKEQRQQVIQSIERAIALCLVVSHESGESVEFRRSECEQILSELRRQYEISYEELGV